MGYHADTCASIILHVCGQARIADQGLAAIGPEVSDRPELLTKDWLL